MRQLIVTFDTTLLLRLIDADVINQGTYEDLKHRQMTRTKWRFSTLLLRAVALGEKKHMYNLKLFSFTNLICNRLTKFIKEF